MRTHLIAITAALSLAGAGAADELRAQSPERVVYVQGAETGRGITRQRDGECFVVAPDHVVRGRNADAETYPPETLYVLDSGNRRIPAVLVAIYPADLAILLVDPRDPRSTSLCASWPALGAINPTLRRVGAGGGRTVGELVGRDRNAGEARMGVVVSSVYDSHFVVQPELEGSEIQTGMSGSLVYVNGVPAGIVQLAADTSSALVYRLDYLEGIIGGFFQDIVPPSHGAVLGSVVFPGMGQHATGRTGVGFVWMGLTAAATATAVMFPRYVTRTLVAPDINGVPQEYPYEVREYPLRRYWPAVWVLGGALSALEAGRYARRHYLGPQRGRRPSSGKVAKGDVTLRVGPELSGGAGGGLAVSVVKLSF